MATLEERLEMVSNMLQQASTELLSVVHVMQEEETDAVVETAPIANVADAERRTRGRYTG
jgi:dTDP-4-dehydrorhamnose reductase